MPTQVNLNGHIDDSASISVFDHGFLFGDSIYEVVVTFKGRPCFLDRHLARLHNSAKGLGLKIPWTNEALKEQINRTLASAGNEESYIRLVVTRGVGEIDIDPSSCKEPHFVIYVTDLKPYPEHCFTQGIHVSLVSVKRNQKEALNPEIKTGNYLNNVLAKMEAGRSGAMDALMLNAQGFLTECTTSNFFFYQDGALRTPSLDCGILEGITREVVIRLAQENGLVVEEGEWPPEMLENIDEAFLTGTIKRIMPITLLDGHPVGTGKPGPVTRKLMNLYDKLLLGLKQG